MMLFTHHLYDGNAHIDWGLRIGQLVERMGGTRRSPPGEPVIPGCADVKSDTPPATLSLRTDTWTHTISS